MALSDGLASLLDHTLPLNRKERYFTGTVLPGIVCADLSQLSRLTALMGVEEIDVSNDPDDCGLLFFTEYGIAESIYDDVTRDRFTGLSTARDTPDVVFLVTRPSPVLFALEAKMYDRPSGTALRYQLDQQIGLLEPLAARLAEAMEVERVPVVHRALLPPEQAAINIKPHEAITWDQILLAYQDVAPPYWTAVLREALARYPDLVTRARPNDEARLSGEDIISRLEAGDLEYAFMGRFQGLDGPKLQGDFESGEWWTRPYQVATARPQNSNWFSVSDFSARVEPYRLVPSQELRAALHEAVAMSERVFGQGSVTEQLQLAENLSGGIRDPSEIRRVAALYRTAAEAARLAREASSRLLDLRSDDVG